MGGPGRLRLQFEEACAVAACRALPGLAALYAGSYPATIEVPLKDIMKECVRFSLPVRADDDDRDGDGVKDDRRVRAHDGRFIGRTRADG